MVLSGDKPAGKWIIISTFAAVLSSIFLILIFPFSFALRIESIKELVVVEKGISVIMILFFSGECIFARTRTLPPLKPSL